MTSRSITAAFVRSYAGKAKAAYQRKTAKLKPPRVVRKSRKR